MHAIGRAQRDSDGDDYHDDDVSLRQKRRRYTDIRGYRPACPANFLGLLWVSAFGEPSQDYALTNRTFESVHRLQDGRGLQCWDASVVNGLWPLGSKIGGLVCFGASLGLTGGSVGVFLVDLSRRAGGIAYDFGKFRMFHGL